MNGLIKKILLLLFLFMTFSVFSTEAQDETVNTEIQTAVIPEQVNQHTCLLMNGEYRQ